MNTRDITTMTDDVRRAEADALTRECIAAPHAPALCWRCKGRGYVEDTDTP